MENQNIFLVITSLLMFDWVRVFHQQVNVYKANYCKKKKKGGGLP